MCDSDYAAGMAGEYFGGRRRARIIPTETYKLLLWRVTDKAVLVSQIDDTKGFHDYTNDEKFWLPKSQIRDGDGVVSDFDNDNEPIQASLIVPNWLAEEHGL